MLRLLAAAIAVAGVGVQVGAAAPISQLLCASTAAQTQIRNEGLAERVGDIVLTCQTSVAGAEVSSSVQVVFSAPVTSGVVPVLTIETGGSVVQTVTGRPTGTNIITFDPFVATLDGSGRATIRISNIRVNASGLNNQQITATLGTTGPTGLGVTPNPTGPAFVQPGLLVNSTVASIFCFGSPTPSMEPLTLGGLFSAGTSVSTLRATEGSADAFQTRLAGADTGTRVLVQLSGFPAGARVYLPTVITGSTATQPTSAGDLGLTRSGGRYTPGATGSLLLSQVAGANTNGVGGSVLYRPDLPGTGMVVFLDAREVPLVNGSGVGVFEVVDANSTVIESAQIPVFVSMPATNGQIAVAEAKLSLGPISTGSEIPRFVANQAPGLDCTILHDCDANYFPHLEVEAPALTFAAQLGTQVFLSKRVIVRNTRDGLMPWTARWVYQDGSDWLNVVVPNGVNQAAFQLDARIEKITTPGLYRATLIVDAGPLAGTVQLPVTFEVTAGAPGSTLPLISAAVNSADSNMKTLAPGSRAVLTGVRFPATPVVTFNGIGATIITSGPERIEVLVPDSLGPAATAQVRVSSAEGQSAPLDVTLGLAAPAFYAGAIYNQDNSPNKTDAAELPGRVLQTFATGLPMAANGRITARINGQPVVDVPYAGPAPGYAGIQQVNLRVPQLAAGAADLMLCGVPNNTGTEVCSAPVRIYIKAQ